MTIKEDEKMKGAAILRLFDEFSEKLPQLSFSLKVGGDRSSFILTANKSKFLGDSKTKSCGLYLKTSTKRITPWTYNFHIDHQKELKRLKEIYNEVFLIFINGNDGFACIDYNELKEVLDEKYEAQERISLSRKLKESYRLTGRDGARKKSLRRSSYPLNIVKYFKLSFTDE